MNKACISYLCGPSDVDHVDLKSSLESLYINFNREFRQDVVVFYENLSDEYISSIFKNAYCNMPINFVKIPCLANDAPNGTVADFHGFNIGYRGMCRWTSGPIFMHEALSQYKWLWHFDTDSLLMKRLRFNPFEYMEQNGKEYGYQVIYREEPYVCEGFWTATKDFITKNNIKCKSLAKYLDANGDWNGQYFYSDFSIMNLNYFRSDAHQSYFRHLDAMNGFFGHRFGDTLVCTMSLWMNLEPEKLHCFANSIKWRHQQYNNI